MFEGLRDRHFPKLAESRLIRAAWRIFTLVAVTAAWIPFRAASFTQTRVMLSSMFLTFDPRHLTLSYSVNFYLVTLLLAVFCAVEPYLGKLFSSISDAVSRNTAALVANMFVFRPVLYACGLLLFMIFDESGLGEAEREAAEYASLNTNSVVPIKPWWQTQANG